MPFITSVNEMEISYTLISNIPFFFPSAKSNITKHAADHACNCGKVSALSVNNIPDVLCTRLGSFMTGWSLCNYGKGYVLSIDSFPDVLCTRLSYFMTG